MLKRMTLLVDGMVCGSCERRIEAGLLKEKGIEEAKADFQRGKVEIQFDDMLIKEERIQSIVEDIGYGIRNTPFQQWKSIVPLLMLLLAGYLVIENTVGFNYLPQISDNMGFGLIFLVGLLTSIHCIGMCGGIALSQSIPSQISKGSKILTPLLYNLGRVISYTVIGAVVGGLGSIITPSGQLKGLVAILAGVFMILFGLKMLNLVILPSWLSLKLPEMRFNKVSSTHPLRPFMIGLLNGFMPCGPLQTMQLYALGTGSVIKGGLSMFFFSMGTVPLVFAFGAVASMINRRAGKSLMKASAALVMVLGLVMLNRGLALSGGGFALETAKGNPKQEIKMENGKQVINLTIGARNYTPDAAVVQAGVPVKINLDVQSINGCNNPIMIPAYGIEKDLTSSDTTIEFTPTKTGPITITCWMGMITTQLTAVGDPSADVEVPSNGSEQPNVSEGGCCGGATQAENKAAAAVIAEDTQIIEMTVGNEGYMPNILIVQKGIPVQWKITGENISYCTSELLIPSAGFSQEIKDGQNSIKFLPEAPGEILFTCGMNMLRGKIVIVDDIRQVDVDEIEKSEIPAGTGGAGCCN
ncbi:MAG: sulfite exporter TauE/SafE family protein [Bacillota bacterium]